MLDRARALDIIERATDATPTCPACWAPTDVRDVDGVLYLQCSATVDPQGWAARFRAVLMPHVRRPILDLRAMSIV